MWEGSQQHFLCLFIVSRVKKEKILNVRLLKSVKVEPQTRCNVYRSAVFDFQWRAVCMQKLVATEQTV